MQWEKKVVFSNKFRANAYISVSKWNLISSLFHSQNNNCRWIINHSVKGKVMKLLEINLEPGDKQTFLKNTNYKGKDWLKSPLKLRTLFKLENAIKVQKDE